MWRVLVTGALVLLGARLATGLSLGGVVDDVKQLFETFVDVLMTFFYHYQKARQEEEDRIDALLGSFTLAVRKVLPSSKPALAIEDTYPLGVYLCANFGRMTDLKTIRKIDKNHYLWHSDGSVDVTFFYQVEDLSITFQTFRFESPMVKKSGNFTMAHKKNRIVVQLHVPEMKTALRNLKNNPCLVYVRKFAFADLGDSSVKIESEGYPSGNWLSDKMMQYLSVRNKDMIELMEREVLTELYYTLPIRPVCKHPDLDAQAAALKAATGKRKYSARFTQHCGQIWRTADERKRDDTKPQYEIVKTTGDYQVLKVHQ